MKYQKKLTSLSMLVIMLLSLFTVLSTSVAASAQEPSLVSASTSSAITVCGIGNDLYLFTKGTDNALWWKHWTATNGWSSPISLGGVLTADPAAVSRSAKTIYVFVRGTNGELWQKSTTDGGVNWDTWQKLPGVLAEGTGPTVTAPDANSLDLFVQGTTNVLWQKQWSSQAGWQSWKDLGGILTSSPAAAARSSTSIDVVVRSLDGTPCVRSSSDGGLSWGQWQRLTGIIAEGTSPALAARDQNTLDLFVQGTTRALYHLTWQSSGGWAASWENLGGILTSSPATVHRLTGGASGAHIDLFYLEGCAYCLKVDPLVINAANKYGVPLTQYEDSQPSSQSAKLANSITVYPTVIIRGAQSTRLEGDVSQTQIETAVQAAIKNTAIDVFVRGTNGAPWWITGTAPSTSTSYTWGSWVGIGSI